MTTERRRRQVATFALLALWFGAAFAIRHSLPVPVTAAPPAKHAPAHAIVFEAAAIESSATEILNRNAFRLDRTPSRTRFLPWPAAEQSPVDQAPRAVVPTLTLVGILSGTPTQVLVEGIPGHERGLLLRRGESVAGFLLLRISGDTVVVEGMDTSWVFTHTRVRE